MDHGTNGHQLVGSVCCPSTAPRNRTEFSRNTSPPYQRNPTSSHLTWALLGRLNHQKRISHILLLAKIHLAPGGLIPIWVWVKIRPPGIGPQVLVHVSTYQGPFGVPIFDPCMQIRFHSCLWNFLPTGPGWVRGGPGVPAKRAMSLALK